MRLNYLHRTDDYQVVWFHDSFAAINRLIEALDRRTYVIYSFSWYASPQRLEKSFSHLMQTLSASSAGQLVPGRVMFLMNSAEEYLMAPHAGSNFTLR